MDFATLAFLWQLAIAWTPQGIYIQVVHPQTRQTLVAPVGCSAIWKEKAAKDRFKALAQNGDTTCFQVKG